MDQQEQPAAPKRRGRPPASSALVRRVAAEQAAATGKMPHEILLDIARGTPLIQSRIEWDAASQTFRTLDPLVLIPDMQMRAHCARDAAPYYAPKLSALEILQGLTDEQLDEALAAAAAEAGYGLAPAGACEAQQAAAHSAGPGDVSAVRG